MKMTDGNKRILSDPGNGFRVWDDAMLNGKLTIE